MCVLSPRRPATRSTEPQQCLRVDRRPLTVTGNKGQEDAFVLIISSSDRSLCPINGWGGICRKQKLINEFPLPLMPWETSHQMRQWILASLASLLCFISFSRPNRRDVVLRSILHDGIPLSAGRSGPFHCGYFVIFVLLCIFPFDSNPSFATTSIMCSSSDECHHGRGWQQRWR